jgi:ABC-type multidrug transport system permease subunit
MGKLRSVTGSVVELVEAGGAETHGGEGRVSIRKDDGELFELAPVVINDEVRSALVPGRHGEFHFSEYTPSGLHFLIGVAGEAGASVFYAVSITYLVGLFFAVLAANVVALPVALLIVERFFLSTMSRLMLAAAYIAAMVFAAYVLFQIVQIRLDTVRLKKRLSL